jgi:hypothetical protein
MLRTLRNAHEMQNTGKTTVMKYAIATAHRNTAQKNSAANRHILESPPGKLVNYA